MPTELQAAYDNGECPDCGEPIPDHLHDGDACLNCGHVLCIVTPCDDE